MALGFAPDAWSARLEWPATHCCHRPTTMSASGFARLPKPPYYAVIFSSRRRGDDCGYAETAQRMEQLVAQQPGFLGAESTRDATGFGITVAYFDSEQSIAGWRDNSEHAAARERGRNEWYEHFELRIARVERAYGGPGLVAA
jgi:heme-degrading monooxygenase HmoA